MATILVQVTKTYEYTCEIEVPDDKPETIKKEVEALTNDDFSELDSCYNIEVFRKVPSAVHGEAWKDITGEIQPNCKIAL